MWQHIRAQMSFVLFPIASVVHSIFTFCVDGRRVVMESFFGRNNNFRCIGNVSVALNWFENSTEIDKMMQSVQRTFVRRRWRSFMWRMMGTEGCSIEVRNSAPHSRLYSNAEWAIGLMCRLHKSCEMNSDWLPLLCWLFASNFVINLTSEKPQRFFVEESPKQQCLANGVQLHSLWLMGEPE